MSMSPEAFARFQKILDDKFKSTLSAGSHRRGDGKCNVFELESVRLASGFTDEPSMLSCLDFRPLNDFEVSERIRNKWMMEMMQVYSCCNMYWSYEQTQRVLTGIFKGLVQQILPHLVDPEIVLPKWTNTFLDEPMDLEGAYDVAISILPYVNEKYTNAVRTFLAGINIFKTGDCQTSSYLAALTSYLSAVSTHESHREQIFTSTCVIWLKEGKRILKENGENI